MSNKCSTNAETCPISRDIDEFVRPFGRVLDRSYRRTVMFGTANRLQYLIDDENRRFWTVQVNDVNAYHDINLYQLWAEVAAMYHSGVSYWLNDDELAMVHQVNKQFVEIPPLVQQLLAKGVEPAKDEQSGKWYHISELLSRIGMDPCSLIESRAIGRWLRANGYPMGTHHRWRIVFRKPEKPQKYEHNDHEHNDHDEH